jgi:hypothetical protein
MSYVPMFKTQIPITFLCFSILYFSNFNLYSFPIPMFDSFSLFCNPPFQTTPKLEVKSSFYFGVPQ